VLGGSPSSPEDLYEVYARLRAEDPIHRTPEGLWILTRYADVSAVLRDPRFGREGFERYFTPDNSASSDGGGHRQSMLFRDPPHHRGCGRPSPMRLRRAPLNPRSG
jgi:cytochrome P450